MTSTSSVGQIFPQITSTDPPARGAGGAYPLGSDGKQIRWYNLVCQIRNRSKVNGPDPPTLNTVHQTDIRTTELSGMFDPLVNKPLVVRRTRIH